MMKRWNSFRCALLMGASVIALSACEEPKVDASVYETLQQCMDDPNVPNQECEKSYKEALGQHA